MGLTQDPLKMYKDAMQYKSEQHKAGYEPVNEDTQSHMKITAPVKIFTHTLQLELVLVGSCKICSISVVLVWKSKENTM